MKKNTLLILLCLFLSSPALLTAKKKWMDDAILKSVFSIIKKSSIKYEFKSVPTLPFISNDAAKNPAPDRDARDILASIRTALKAGKYPLAAQRIQSARHDSPYSPDPLCLRAQLALAQKNVAGALVHLQQAIFLDRRHPETLRLLQKVGYRPTERTAPVPVILRKKAAKSVYIYYDGVIRRQKTHLSWIAYSLCRAFWRFEGVWKQRYPDARWYRPSYEEDLFCYKALVHTWTRTKKRDPEVSNADLERLLALEESGLLGGYVFFHVYDRPIGPENAYILKQYANEINGYYKQYFRKD